MADGRTSVGWIRGSTIPLVIVTLLAALGGCRASSDPRVRGVGAHVLEQSPDAMQLGIDLELTNPGDEPVKMLELQYTVAAQGRTVFRGRRAAQVTVDRAGVRRMTVPAVVRYEQVGWGDGPPATFDYTISGRLRYLLPGALNRTLMEIGLRRPVVDFSGRGTVEVAPGAALSSRATPAEFPDPLRAR